MRIYLVSYQHLLYERAAEILSDWAGAAVSVALPLSGSGGRRGTRRLVSAGRWRRIDEAVAGALLAALTPAGVKAATVAAESLEADHDQALEQWRLQSPREGLVAGVLPALLRLVDGHDRPAAV